MSPVRLALERAIAVTDDIILPFTLHHDAGRAAVSKKDNCRPVPASPNEGALGSPTARLEINFD